ncbi:MAG TPA: cupin domain-containing protein [Dongiaceae bacterium]|jgi:predicted cupin superfamily sugar epimerase|nr:cupin domain-containing protein [Dongiaceae bacterium]
MNRPVSDTAAALIAQLDLKPHPEGGHYRETYRDRPSAGGRAKASLIYYLLQAGEVSHWHRVNDADEIWLFQGGSPMELTLSPDGQRREDQLLGTDVANGERPQILVPQGCWQAARSLGLYTLTACLVTPAFDFAGFEMAPPGWAPSMQGQRDAGKYLSPRGRLRRR